MYIAGLYALVLKQNAHFWPEDVPPSPSPAPDEERVRRTLFMIEEAMEYASAKTLEEQLDALVDIVVVALGTAVLQGFHAYDVAFERVVRANMQKVRGSTAGRPGWSHDLAKPPGWKPASLADLVGESALPQLGAEILIKSDATEQFARKEDEAMRRSIDDATPQEWDAASAVAREIHPSREPAPTTREREVRLTRYEFRSGGFIETLAQVHPILLECAGLLNRKSLDYGDPDHSKASYHPFGHASYMQMLHTKFLRLRTLTVDAKAGERPNFESARDTVLDLINYAAFYASWMDEQEAALKQKEKA